MTSLAATFNTADKSAPGHYGASQTALLLLDFHSMFVEKVIGPKAPAILDIAAKMQRWAHSRGIQVIHCLLDIDDTPFLTCKDFERFAGVVAAMRLSGAEEPTELLKDAGDDVTFKRKPGYISALRSPGLEDFLQKKGIRSLILTGLTTSGCVLRTAITTSDAEYVVTVLSDGCADPSQEVHDFLVGHMFGQRGYVTTAIEFQEGFSKAAGDQ